LQHDGGLSESQKTQRIDVVLHRQAKLSNATIALPNSSQCYTGVRCCPVHGALPRSKSHYNFQSFVALPLDFTGLPPSSSPRVRDHRHLSFFAILKEDFRSFRTTVRGQREVRPPRGRGSRLPQCLVWPLALLFPYESAGKTAIVMVKTIANADNFTKVAFILFLLSYMLDRLFAVAHSNSSATTVATSRCAILIPISRAGDDATCLTYRSA